MREFSKHENRQGHSELDAERGVELTKPATKIATRARRSHKHSDFEPDLPPVAEMGPGGRGGSDQMPSSFSSSTSEQTSASEANRRGRRADLLLLLNRVRRTSGRSVSSASYAGDGALEALPGHPDRLYGGDEAGGWTSDGRMNSIYDGGSTASAASATSGFIGSQGGSSSRKMLPGHFSPLLTTGASSLGHHRDASARPSLASFSESCSDESVSPHISVGGSGGGGGQERLAPCSESCSDESDSLHSSVGGSGGSGGQERGQRGGSPTTTTSFLSLSSRVREKHGAAGVEIVLMRRCRWLSLLVGDEKRRNLRPAPSKR